VDPKKKSLSASERDEAARAAWRVAAASLIAERLVFVDECGAHLAHTRAYAYAPRHERAVGRVPKNRGRVTTLIASLTPAGMGPCRTLLGGTSKAVFLSYLREELAPTLTPGQVVILDNLGAHRPQEVAAIIAERGARVLYLPGYSPDFNPIELAFGKLKAGLRQAGARTRDALEAAIAAALAAITRTDATAFFAHCGFPLSAHPQGQG
jgi:transposase